MHSDVNVSAASTSTDANLPIDDEDDVRPPILPKREQLILPSEDNFRYRKRRTVAARTVCPLRNFELEGRLQEERLQAAVMGNFTAAAVATTTAAASNDRITEAIDSSTAAAHSINFPPAAAANAKILGFSNDTNDLIHNKLTGGLGSSSSGSGGGHTNHVTKSAVPSRLSELFRPPVDITFCGSFQAARDYAKDQNKWLIVNVQDMSDFNCQVLNRDIWSSEKLRAVIKKYFVFWQVAIDNVDGHRFQVFYGIQKFPYVGVLDPRTGEERLSYKTGFKLTHDEFMNKLKDYLCENTPHPNAVSKAASDRRLFTNYNFHRYVFCFYFCLRMPKMVRCSNWMKNILKQQKPQHQRQQPIRRLTIMSHHHHAPNENASNHRRCLNRSKLSWQSVIKLDSL